MVRGKSECWRKPLADFNAEICHTGFIIASFLNLFLFYVNSSTYTSEIDD